MEKPCSAPRRIDASVFSGAKRPAPRCAIIFGYGHGAEESVIVAGSLPLSFGDVCGKRFARSGVAYLQVKTWEMVNFQKNFMFYYKVTVIEAIQIRLFLV
jgi:hypothetical protein